MKTLYKILLLPIFSAAIAEVSGQATFIRTYDLPLNATITSIAATDDSGMIIAGHTDSLGQLYRSDPLGNLIWSKQYGGRDNTVQGAFFLEHQVALNDVVTVPDGFVVVGTSIADQPNGGAQQFSMKVTPTGEMVWMRHGGNLWSDSLLSVGAAEPGYVLTGGSNGSLTGTRATISKLDHATGEIVAGGSAYLFMNELVEGNLRYLHIDAQGYLTGLGDYMIFRFDDDLQPVWGIVPGPDLYWVEGLAVLGDGSGIALATNRLIGFSDTGVLQFDHSIPSSYGTASAILADNNGNYQIAGEHADGTIWLSAVDISGDVLWTSGYGEVGSMNQVQDMTLLPNGLIAISSITGTPAVLQLIVTAGDTSETACSQIMPSPIFASTPPTTIDTVLFGPSVTGSSFPEALEPWSTNSYPQSYPDCSSGLFTAAGSVYHDSNENGDLDAGEDLLTGRVLQLQPNGISTWITSNGYSFILGQPGMYDIVHDPGPFWALNEGAGGYTIDFTENDTIFTALDFGYVPLIDTTEVITSINGGQLPCNSITQQFLNIENIGTTTPELVVAFSYDPLLTFQNAQPPPDSITANNVIYWTIDPVGYFENELIVIEFFTPPVTSLGDTLIFTADLYESDNGLIQVPNGSSLSSAIVTCAYDPNYKLVDPPGEGNAGGISPGTEWLTYTVHFQNIGTDTVTNVVIADQLSTYLDLGSFEILGHSHEITSVNMSSAGLMEFRFDGIMLPDSGSDQLGSQGFIQYRVRLIQELAVGTAIMNDAAVFFDQNPAVITNTVINTIRDCALDQPEVTIEFDGYYLTALSPDINYMIDEYIYAWYLNGELIQSSVSYAFFPVVQDGIYTVEVIDPVGCVTIPEPYVLIGTSIGNAVDEWIRVRPNPFSIGTTIGFSSPLAIGTVIELLDIQGRIVRSEIGTSSGAHYLERGDLEAGVYLLRVRQGDRNFVLRVIAE